MTPWSKHYAIKYHWFPEQIGPHNINLVKIGSADQFGDLFTKGLDCIIFSRLQKNSWVGKTMLALSRGSIASIGW
jgi:hypothetical protein